MSSRLDRLAHHPATLAGLWAACVTLVAVLADHFWIPLDDGTLAQSAERVLAGELPHRDFGDPYTGLNALVGALSFKLLGVSLGSLRVPLVIAYALWLPAVWVLAQRFAGPAVATGASVLIAVTSVLAYPAAMPTWFGLFAVTWGLAFLVHGVDGGTRVWLFAAGLAGGVSILFKITGLYFVAAVLLTLVWRRQGGVAYATACGVGIVLFVALLGRLVLPGAAPPTVVHFFVPGLAVALVATWRIRPRDVPSLPAFSELIRDGAAFLGGVALPVALFLIPYALSGGLGAWLEGVFLLPARRFGAASSSPGPSWTVAPGVVAVALAWWSSRMTEAGRRWLAWGLTALLTVALSLDDVVGGAIFSALWYSARSWIPPLVVWGAFLALGSGEAALFAMVATAGLWALVQFPYTAPAYAFYVAPLGILATLAVVRALGGGSRPILAIMAILWLFLGGGYTAGVVGSGDTELGGDRGGIHVTAVDAILYDLLVTAVEARMESGHLWVTPDAPEVYFLTGRPNPTRTFYEFLEPPSEGAEPPPLDEVDVVVLNTRPLFSPAPDEALRRRLADHGFSLLNRMGAFEVHGRGGGSLLPSMPLPPPVS